MELDHYNRIKKYFKLYEIQAASGLQEFVTLDELIDYMRENNISAYKLTDKATIYVFKNGKYKILKP